MHIHPPRPNITVADAIFKCLKDWGLESKVYIVSVDNASNNDISLRYLKDIFSRNKCLLAKGKLFHVRCCAHIFNLIVQDGLTKIQEMIQAIRDNVEFVNKTKEECLIFAEIVQKLQLPEKVLLYDYKIR